MSHEKLFNSESVYPCTIIFDRYGGTYSGGAWLAIYLDFWDLDFQKELSDIDGCDPDCAMFWGNNPDNRWIIGRGATPNEAVVDMKRRLDEYHENCLDAPAQQG